MPDLDYLYLSMPLFIALLQVFPELYNWTTYPLVNLIERMYDQIVPLLEQSQYPEATLVELCAAAERALNYMHTGNTAVIATSVMKPLWVGNAIIRDGLPCFNPQIVSMKVNAPISVFAENWPYDEARYQPKSSSLACQLFSYGPGNSHFNVSCWVFLVTILLGLCGNFWLEKVRPWLPCNPCTSLPDILCMLFG